jgi:hypothetical protein
MEGFKKKKQQDRIAVLNFILNVIFVFLVAWIYFNSIAPLINELQIAAKLANELQIKKIL